MKEYPSDSIRNVALVGHSGTGKTTLAEAMLFAAGAVTRLGTIEDHTTTSDWDPDEHKRTFSLSLSIIPLEWNDHKINIIDTPGYMDFMGEVKCGLRAVETALISIDAVSSLQVGTEFAWRFADELELPRAFLINRMDRDNADFDRCVTDIQTAWGNKCLPVTLPIGAESSFQGVVDLLTMKAYTGDQGEEGPIPDDLQGAADQAREKLIEAAAETDDALVNKYLEGEELTADELSAGVRAGIASGSLVPIFAGAGAGVLGVRRLLTAITEYFPAPTDRIVQAGDNELKCDSAAPLAALVFKTAADPYVGRLTYFRVLSGTVAGDSHAWNATKDVDERIGTVYHITGKTQDQVPQIVAGDIGAVAKLAETQTGDTLCAKGSDVKLEPISFPSPSASAAVSPKTKADLDKMGSALHRIVEEDPSLRLERNADTGEMILSGLGDSHVEVNLERVKRKFGVELEMHTPRVPYRETVRSKGQAEYTHKKQTGGHGQFARVALEIGPLPRGSGVQFEDRIVGGSVPKQYIGSVEKGVMEGSREGVLAHFPMVDAKIVLVDGREHPVDSSDMAFKLAAAMALREATEAAHPILLEPIMDMQITVPEANTGDVISDLNGKRARVQGMNPSGAMTTIEAQAPLPEVQHYSADMRSLTQGRGFFTIEFSHYEEVPAHAAQKVIEEANRDREEAKT
ncbi:MAG: elongation factor G [Chloroflexi bacterium]|nr:elongation factor G [Chloroflexota bacterium]MCH7952407.1 elongation factor G [Chloroflexota bacterium]MCI0820683.1 elongation factor G [Chloroflexota bacterium]MCI0842597.1 elongation factor G [Chloroflexota bacterium]